MPSAASAILTRARIHLEEATANEFTDAQLYNYISDGHRFVAAQLSEIDEAGWFEKESTVTVSASTETGTLPTDFLRATVVQWVDSNSNRHDLIPIPRSKITEMRTATAVSGDVEPGYFLRQYAIHVLPISTSARTLKIQHTYEPAAFSATTTLETPDRYDHVIALYAAIRALADDQRKDDNWNSMLHGFVAEMVQRECQRRDRGHGQSVEMVYTQ